jgi:hypothetical protein
MKLRVSAAAFRTPSVPQGPAVCTGLLLNRVTEVVEWTLSSLLKAIDDAVRCTALGRLILTVISIITVIVVPM